MWTAHSAMGMAVAMSLGAASCSVTIDFGNSQFSCEQTQECPGDQTCLRGVCGFGLPIDASPPQMDAGLEVDAADGSSPFVCPSDCSDLAASVETCFCPNPLTWEQAESHCASTELSLVRVDSMGRSLEMRALAEADVMVWLAGRDNEVEGTWRWPNGDVFWVGNQAGSAPDGVFTDWLPQEPNDAAGLEDCGGTVSGGWNDAPCTNMIAFACERPTL